MRTQALLSDECVVLPVQQGAVLRCTRGLLWLTYEPAAGDACGCQDRLLAPGTDWRAPARGTAFVSRVRSQPKAAFCLHEAPPRPQGGRMASLLRRLARAGWLGASDARPPEGAGPLRLRGAEERPAQRASLWEPGP